MVQAAPQSWRDRATGQLGQKIVTWAGQKETVVVARNLANAFLAMALLNIFAEFGVPGEPCMGEANLVWNFELATADCLGSLSSRIASGAVPCSSRTLYFFPWTRSSESTPNWKAGVNLDQRWASKDGCTCSSAPGVLSNLTPRCG